MNTSKFTPRMKNVYHAQLFCLDGKTYDYTSFHLYVKIIRKFNSENKLKNNLCRYYVQIYGTYLFILLLIYHEVYVYRLRRCAMAYFYFSREKQRVLHLYNKCLKKRRGMFQLMSATVREQNCSSKGRPMHSVRI